VRADADGSGALFPESVLSKRKQVMRHGSPRYRTKPLLGFLSDFPSWGVIRVVPRIYFVPEPYAASGIFLLKGELTNDEFFVTEKAAKEGIVITNTSTTEPIVMLKHFAENPELEL